MNACTLFESNRIPSFLYFIVSYNVHLSLSYTVHTDRKENKISLIYKEIQNGAVPKSYMTNDLLTYGKIFAHFLIY